MRKILFFLIIPLIVWSEPLKERVPSFKLPEINGKIFDLNKHIGKKVIIINFWATWCHWCRAEIPGLINLYKKYKKEGLLVVGVSVDRGKNAGEKVKKFAKDYNINYPLVIATSEVIRKFGSIPAIPTTFVVNKKGEIVKKIIGFRNEEFFENLIKELL